MLNLNLFCLRNANLRDKNKKQIFGIPLPIYFPMKSCPEKFYSFHFFFDLQKFDISSIVHLLDTKKIILKESRRGFRGGLDMKIRRMWLRRVIVVVGLPPLC